MTRIKGSAVQDIQERRNELNTIISNFETRGKKFTKKILVEELAKKGFRIDARTLYRDLVVIMKDDSFVRDLAKSTYSAYIHRIFDEIDGYDEKIHEWMEDPPKTHKRILEYDQSHPMAKPKIKRVIEETTSKTEILKLGLRIQEFRINALKGDLVNTSVALLSKDFQRLEIENEELQRINSRFEEERKTVPDQSSDNRKSL